MKAEGLQSGCCSSGLHQPGCEGGEFTHGDVMKADNHAVLPHEKEMYKESGRFASGSDPHLAPHRGLDHLFCSRDSMHSKHPVPGDL